jgi:hypothetical protein
MPTSLVKTPRDERLWQKAKDIADEAGHAENWAYVMGVYKKMNPDRFDKSAALSTSMAMYLREEIARALQRPIPAARKQREVGAVVHELLAFLGGQEFADTMSDKVTQGIIRSAPRTAGALTEEFPMAEAKGMAARVASRHLRAFDPGHRSDKGYTPGSVQQQAPYRGVGSQVPEPRDRDGHVIEVPQYGMMRIPGYEWHDKSTKFHSGS